MWTTAVVLLVAALAGCHAFTWEEQTALDEYVHRDDGMFSWSVLTSYRFDNDSCTVYILNMTSQRYMDDSFTSRSIWWHYMGVAVPDVIKRDYAYMFIDGGGNNPGSSPPDQDDDRVTIARTIAKLAGYFGAFLLQVPNQPHIFSNDPVGDGRTEDAFIAWTWKTFLDTHYDTPEVIARMPMTKAGKRGLDTINEFVLSILPEHDVKEFCVGGGSKRGWTAWSVAATDRRVTRVTPMVMSLLNMNDTLQSHYRSLGGWSFVFNDYYKLNLTQHFHDDRVTNWENGLWNYEDMIRYKERLELIPKLLVSACGDEFFLLTDSHTWWDQMAGPKWIMMVPNAEHSLAPWYLKIGETVAQWLMLTLEESLPEVPRLAWLRGGGRIQLSVDQEPDEIVAWTAETWRNDTRRDFRLAVGYPPFLHPVLWSRLNVTTHGPGSYEVTVTNDGPGYTGVFIDCIYTRFGDGTLKLHLNTEVEIVPNNLPFPPCYGASCWSELT